MATNNLRNFMRLKKQAQSNLGIEPTTAQKIINTTSKLGLNFQKQQGSAVNIYDTVTLATSAQPQTLTFFKNTGSKVKAFSNWQAGEFKAGESLSADHFTIQIVQLLNTNLSDSANTISNFLPIGKTLASLPIAFGNMQLKIANVTVFKDYQMVELLPNFNPKTQGIAAYDIGAGVAPSILGRSIIEMATQPTIPPNQGIELIVEIPPITLPAGNFGLMVTIGRQGSIFSAKIAL